MLNRLNTCLNLIGEKTFNQNWFNELSSSNFMGLLKRKWKYRFSGVKFLIYPRQDRNPTEVKK
jgi:hypothetical protein